MSSNKLDTIVNANNNQSHWLGVYPPEKQLQRLAQIPLADYIIATHCPHSWKNDRNSYNYRTSQQMICENLVSADVFGPYTYRRIAWMIDCNPIVLMNDPKLKDIVPA